MSIESKKKVIEYLARYMNFVITCINVKIHYIY